MLKLVSLEKGQKGRLPEAGALCSQELQDRFARRSVSLAVSPGLAMKT